MVTKTDGLVIREINVGDNDRIITILTREKGIVRASARGARRVKSHISSATTLLSFSAFTLFHGREKYIINEAEPLGFFLGLREDIERLTLAQYFAELALKLAPEEEPANDYLRLILNGLHLLSEGKRPPLLVKAAVELRMLSLSGYMPDLVACRSCGSFEHEIMCLDIKNGNIECGFCAEHPEASGGNFILRSSSLAAMRHIIYSDFEKIFSFSLSDGSLKELSRASEAYLLFCNDRGFATLDFYHTL